MANMKLLNLIFQTYRMDKTQKIKKFHALLAVNHMMAAKVHVLAGYGVESTLHLTSTELDQAIERLQHIQYQKSEPVSDEIRTWRHNCLKAMGKYIDTRDWSRVNAFLLDKRILGKHLYEANITELQTLHKKLHSIKDVYAEKDHKIKRLTLLN